MEENNKIEEKVEEIVQEEPKIAIEDKVYRLEEMKDAMEKSADNCAKIIGEQKHLVEYLDKDETKSFEELSKESKKQIDNLNEQYSVLTQRIHCLDDVLKVVKDDEASKLLLNTFMAAIGMFEE